MKKLSTIFFTLLIFAVLLSFFVIIALVNPEIGYHPEKQALYLLNSLLNLNQRDTIVVSLFVLVVIGLLLAKVRMMCNKTKNITKSIILAFFILVIPTIFSVILFVYGEQLRKISLDGITPLVKPGKITYPLELGPEIQMPTNINIDTSSFIHLSSMADFSKDDVLMGSSHNVFIGRVIKEAGNKSRWSVPETQFQVEVIDNIKGDLKGTVTVDQFGGYKNGTLVTVEEEGNGTNEPYLLEPGQTYLLATRYLESENWYTVISSSYGKKLLSKDANANITDLKTLAQNDERVKALTTAYPNEKLLDADIQHNNTRNNYKDYEAKLKAERESVSAEQAIPPPETAPNATDTAPVITPTN